MLLLPMLQIVDNDAIFIRLYPFLTILIGKKDYLNFTPR
jgi:hypothetical protein